MREVNELFPKHIVILIRFYVYDLGLHAFGKRSLEIPKITFTILSYCFCVIFKLQNSIVTTWKTAGLLFSQGESKHAGLGRHEDE